MGDKWNKPHEKLSGHEKPTWLFPLGSVHIGEVGTGAEEVSLRVTVMRRVRSFGQRWTTYKTVVP